MHDKHEDFEERQEVIDLFGESEDAEGIVGLRVRALQDDAGFYEKGDTGTVTFIDADGDPWVRFHNKPHGARIWSVPREGLEILEDQR